MNANHKKENRLQQNRGQRELHRIDDEMMVAEVVFTSLSNSDEVRFTDEAQNATEDQVMLIDDLSIEPARRAEPTVVGDLVVIDERLQKEVAVVEYIAATDELVEPMEVSGSNEQLNENLQTPALEGEAEGDTHATALRLPYSFWDKVLFSSAILVGLVGGGLSAWMCCLNFGQVGDGAWLGSMLGGAMGVGAGAVMATLMLNGYGKYIYNRKGDAWKRSHMIPKTREGGLAILLKPLLEPGVLIVFLIFAALGGFVSMAAMSSLPIWAAIGFVWLGIPVIGCILGLTLILDFEDLK